MKFSIITCTWNSAAWLAESIASVDAQRYPHIERVFVDGGSDDGTLDMIRAVPGEVKILEGVRGGIGRAMNEGVRVATGDVFAHLHSDDYYVDGNVLAKVATGLADSRAEWLYGRCKSVIDGRLADNDFVTKRFSWYALIRANIIPHPATFMRRQAFLDLGAFDESLRYAMDYDMWLKMARHHDPVQLDDYLAAFRFHAGSLSTRQARATHAEEWKVRMRHAGHSYVERAEHLARHTVRTMKKSLKPQSRGGFRA